MAGKPAKVGRTLGKVVSGVQLGFRNAFLETFQVGGKSAFREVQERQREKANVRNGKKSSEGDWKVICQQTGGDTHLSYGHAIRATWRIRNC